jgi:hypothetical protein
MEVGIDVIPNRAHRDQSLVDIRGVAATNDVVVVLVFFGNHKNMVGGAVASLFVEVVPRPIRLLAVLPMAVYFPLQLFLGFVNPLLAIVRRQWWDRGCQQKAAKDNRS